MTPLARIAIPGTADFPLENHAKPSTTQARSLRAEQLVRKYYSFVWRTARGMGLCPADSDDVAQRVMIIGSERLDDLIEGKEKAFLFRTTYHLVRRVFRSSSRRPECLVEDAEVGVDPRPGLDELADQQRALREFGRIVASLPEKLRLPFLLFEIEGCTKPEIAEVLGIAVGTAASRIRRAREVFQNHVARARAMRGGMS